MAITIIGYLGMLTVGGFIFLVSVHMIHVRQIKKYYDSIDNSEKALEVGINVLVLVIDFLSENAKYVLIALVVSTVSAIVYISAIRRPARWKSYAIIIIGIACIWFGLGSLIPGATPGKFGENLNLIIAITIIVIGHIYIVTSAIQFLLGVKDEEYFLDVKEGIRERAVLALSDRVSSVISAKIYQDEKFMRFVANLGDVRWLLSPPYEFLQQLLRDHLFSDTCYNYALVALQLKKHDIQGLDIDYCVNTVWKDWDREPWRLERMEAFMSNYLGYSPGRVRSGNKVFIISRIIIKRIKGIFIFPRVHATLDLFHKLSNSQKQKLFNIEVEELRSEKKRRKKGLRNINDTSYDEAEALVDEEAILTKMSEAKESGDEKGLEEAISELGKYMRQNASKTEEELLGELSNNELDTLMKFRKLQNKVKEKRVEEAITFYEKIVEFTPWRESTLHDIGMAHKESGRFWDSIEWFEKALGVNPENLITIRNLAMAKALAGGI